MEDAPQVGPKEQSEPSRETSQGFTRARYLSDEQLGRIFEGIAKGRLRLGEVCRQAGTSVTQFTRRCKREPELDRRSKEAYEARKRARA